jgi:hypothetical protein
VERRGKGGEVRRDKGRRVEGRWKGGRGRESRRDEREGVMEMPIKIRVSASAHSTQHPALSLPAASSNTLCSVGGGTPNKCLGYVHGW